jgi:hypothetical protein
MPLIYGCVAQSVEHWAFNLMAAGSSPAAPIIKETILFRHGQGRTKHALCFEKAKSHKWLRLMRRYFYKLIKFVFYKQNREPNAYRLRVNCSNIGASYKRKSVLFYAKPMKTTML